jgi:hypothetical protein
MEHVCRHLNHHKTLSGTIRAWSWRGDDIIFPWVTGRVTISSPALIANKLGLTGMSKVYQFPLVLVSLPFFSFLLIPNIPQKPQLNTIN